MKKLLTSVFIIYALTFAFGANEKKSEERIIKLSVTEWNAVKKRIDASGYCQITDQHAVIIITNNCPNVERILPLILPKPTVDLERNPLRLEGKRGDRRKKDDVEPKLYFGQSL